MNPTHRIPTKEEEAGIHRKVQLVMSMAGQDTDTAMTVLLYAVTFRAIADELELEGLIKSFRMIHAQIERQQNVNR